MFDNIGNEEMKTNSKISNEVIGCHWVKKKRAWIQSFVFGKHSSISTKGLLSGQLGKQSSSKTFSNSGA